MKYPEDFDSICRACRKKMLLECGKDAAEESSTTSSSSTGVSKAGSDLT